MKNSRYPEKQKYHVWWLSRVGGYFSRFGLEREKGVSIRETFNMRMHGYCHKKGIPISPRKETM
jgi:hypothetical protein